MQTRREVERRGRSAYFTASQPELQSCALCRRLKRPFWLFPNQNNSSFSETVRNKNEFTRQLAVLEGIFDNEIFTFFLRPFHVFKLTFEIYNLRF